MICKRVIYAGRVQGVGFRYTAQRLASDLAVSGFVRNLRDGTVELVAEGEEAEVDALLKAVASALESCIVAANVEVRAAQGLTSFEIRH